MKGGGRLLANTLFYKIINEDISLHSSRRRKIKKRKTLKEYLFYTEKMYPVESHSKLTEDYYMYDKQVMEERGRGFSQEMLENDLMKQVEKIRGCF